MNTRYGLLYFCTVMVLLPGCGGSGSAAPSAPAQPQVQVPRMTGLTMHEAQCRLARAGLRWEIDGAAAAAEPDAPCQPGMQVDPDPPLQEQKPTAGTTVPRGTIIRLQTICRQQPQAHDCQGMIAADGLPR